MTHLTLVLSEIPGQRLIEGKKHTQQNKKIVFYLGNDKVSSSTIFFKEKEQNYILSLQPVQLQMLRMMQTIYQKRKVLE